MSSLNGNVYLKARNVDVSSKSPPPHLHRERWRGRGEQKPRNKASNPLRAPLTIIKMPRLKGDIPNLRLFVSIKSIPALLSPSRPSCTHQCITGRAGAVAEVSRVNGNSIHFIKPTGPTIPETFNFAGVTS